MLNSIVCNALIYMFVTKYNLIYNYMIHYKIIDQQ